MFVSVNLSSVGCMCGVYINGACIGGFLCLVSLNLPFRGKIPRPLPVQKLVLAVKVGETFLFFPEFSPGIEKKVI